MQFLAGVTHPSEIRQRDPDFEHRFFEHIRTVYGAMRPGQEGEIEPFLRSVAERLAIGAERYGDTDFLTKDNVAEAADECPDLAAYGMLELEKHILRGADPDLIEDARSDFVAAAVKAAEALAFIRAGRRKLDDQ